MFLTVKDHLNQTRQHNALLLTADQQAIVALCTPRGSGAIALIRISGVNAVAVADALTLLSSGLALANAPSHTIHHGHVVDREGKRIDEVLFLLMRAPKTFTGQDCVEITSHNNPFVIEAIIDLAVQHGARIAGAGEFSKRAFLNGKMDLLQAEALNDLIHAQTEASLHRSLAQLRGSFSERCAVVEQELVHLLSYIEASFEFLDEEQRDLNFAAAVMDRTQNLLTHIKNLKVQFSQQKQVKDGVCIAIVGVVNAGKSTLFNALVGHERAIVTPIAGTTRDSVETGMYQNGNFWQLVDTAGMRQTTDIVEQKGIERSFALAERADIVILTFDASHELDDQQRVEYQQLIQKYGHKIIGVVNKIDCAPCSADANQLLPDQALVSVSAQQGLGIEVLKERINATIQAFYAASSAPFLINQRQFKLLTEIATGLEIIASSYSNGIHYELVAYHVKDLLEKVSTLTGKAVTERMLDTVFGEFCVGK